MKNTRFFSKVSGTLVSLSVLACDAGSVESTDPAEKMTFRDYPSVCDDLFSEAEIQTITFDQELLVKRKTVVTDPCRTGWTQLGCGTKLGKWTAWQHFTVLAGGGDPSVFIHDWFKTFFVPSQPGNVWTVFELTPAAGGTGRPTLNVINSMSVQDTPADIL